jgi:DNA-nicking Smr family endonuclease
VRRLSAEEQALWEQVAATIRPLSRERLKPAQQPEDLAAAPRPKPAARRSVPAAPSKPSSKSRSSNTLDSSWDRRLRSGAVEPDRVIDLHGLTLDRAWNAIDSGLDRAIGAGERIVLLITGHSRSGEPPVQRGKIRAAVHHWLEASRHAPSIAAVRGAHGRHGGGGSLYIILRRARSKSTVS